MCQENPQKEPGTEDLPGTSTVWRGDLVEDNECDTLRNLWKVVVGCLATRAPRRPACH
jgi:hypothetical protein